MKLTQKRDIATKTSALLEFDKETYAIHVTTPIASARVDLIVDTLKGDENGLRQTGWFTIADEAFKSPDLLRRSMQSGLDMAISDIEDLNQEETA